MKRVMGSLAELERLQTGILHRISHLELSYLPHSLSHSLSLSDSDDSTTTHGRLSAILAANGVRDFSFKRVPSDYYDWTLEARRDVLGASSIHHLCKSIVLVNTQAPADVTDCSNRNNSKYYVVVVQYTARFNAETVKNFLYTLNEGKISKKKFNIVYQCGVMDEEVLIALCYPCECIRVVEGGKFHGTAGGGGGVGSWAWESLQTCAKLLHAVELGVYVRTKFPEANAWVASTLRLAPEETSMKLTGYERNGVTCVGMKTDIPVILDEAIVKLNPDFFWLGGGEVDLKLGIKTTEFINYTKPFIINCSGN
ncbi:hypothetical protein SASPL_111984 [Salvia splendens]|uniref:YbaK/aminoacyl-tRNA synthetase-associated domain-containing protein n=1 Tax=Salvia splendens TaxID=180675 RepID=A0A8X9A3T7_SALSN|nr:hypothetical protein SASPL_111984 [Salvia splendens]